MPFGGKLLRGTLPARHRELVILRTAWNCRVRYEWGQHVGLGRDAGLTDAEIARAPDGPGGWDGVDAAVLKATDECHHGQCIGDTTWSVLTGHFVTAQLIELPMLVGHYTMLAMTLNSLGVQLDAGLPRFPH